MGFRLSGSALAPPILIALGCQPLAEPQPIADNVTLLGRYVAQYDASSRRVTYRHGNPPELGVGQRAAGLIPDDDSTGVANCAIRDTSLTPGDINYCLGLVDPDSCSTNWNPTTRVLSFFSKLRNRSNELDNGSPFTYDFPGTWAPNTTYYSPFRFVITGFQGSSGMALLEHANTNLPATACGSPTGALNVNLASVDSDGNGYADCIWPDMAYSGTFAGYPGFDFSPHISADQMAPGDDSGCVLFMQFTLARDESFALYFDMLAVSDGAGIPPTPTVAIPGNGWVFRSAVINANGGNCTPGATVYVEGGASTSSTPCTGGGSWATTVSLNTNAVNNLSFYQIDGGVQSGAVTRTVTHDQVPPTVLGSSPSDGQLSVDRNTNCVITFSEALDPATVNTTNVELVEAGGSPDVTGTVTLSASGTQIIVEPASKPMAADTTFECTASAAVTDVAGNTLGSDFTASFTTGGGGNFYNDQTPPRVLMMNPPDNQPNVSPDTIFTIVFDEPVDAATIAGSVVSPACNTTGGNIPNVFVFELNTCNPGTSVPIPGTTVLNAYGDIATFTPNNPGDMEDNNCYGFVLTDCVTDLSGNRLANRGERFIGAYSGDGVTYNSYNIFFTSTADSTGPSLVSVVPPAGATGVHPLTAANMVFDEPLDPSTINSTNFFVREQGASSNLAVGISVDSTLQVVSFDPIAAYSLGTQHTLTVTGNITDFSGNQMSAPQTSSFTTTATADTTAPALVQIVPGSGANVNDKCPTIDINFSEAMDPQTINGTNIELIRVRTGSTKPISLVLSTDGMFLRGWPESSLNTGGGNRNDWEISISGNVADLAGNTLGADYSHIFEVFTENTAPQVAGVVPPDGGTTQRNGSVLVIFSEIMDKSTLTASNFPITGCNPIVFVDPDGEWAIANCINQMTTGNKTITINRNVRDYYNGGNNQSCENGSGNRMTANVTSDFTVLAGDDTTAPTVNTVSPADGSTSVAAGVAPTITFSEAVDPRTITRDTVYLVSSSGARVDASLSLSTNARTVTLTPTSNLSGALFNIVATTAVRDLGGGNSYDGAGGETVELAGILHTCFSLDSTPCP